MVVIYVCRFRFLADCTHSTLGVAHGLPVLAAQAVVVPESIPSSIPRSVPFLVGVIVLPAVCQSTFDAGALPAVRCGGMPMELIQRLLNPTLRTGLHTELASRVKRERSISVTYSWNSYQSATLGANFTWAFQSLDISTQGMPALTDIS